MHIVIPDLPWSPYALIVMLALVLGFCEAALLMRKSGVAKETITYTLMLTGVTTVVMSVTASVIDSDSITRFGFSGLGAIAGVISGCMISGMIFRDRPEYVMSSFICASSLMYGLSKTGCLLAGCCRGFPYEGPLAISYGTSHISYFPAQFADMIIFLTLHIVSLILLNRMRDKMAFIYIIIPLLTVARFLIEYLRSYNDGKFLGQGHISVIIAGGMSLILMIIWKGVVINGKLRKHRTAG